MLCSSALTFYNFSEVITIMINYDSWFIKLWFIIFCKTTFLQNIQRFELKVLTFKNCKVSHSAIPIFHIIFPPLPDTFLRRLLYEKKKTYFKPFLFIRVENKKHNKTPSRSNLQFNLSWTYNYNLPGHGSQTVNKISTPRHQLQLMRDISPSTTLFSLIS